MKILDKIWCNGKITTMQSEKISIASHSLQYGVGVFDGIMAYWNQDHHSLFFGKEHYLRFNESAKSMGFKKIYTVEELINATHALLEFNKGYDLYIRPIVFHHAEELRLTYDFSPEDETTSILLMPMPFTKIKREISCNISSFLRVNGNAIPVQSKVCAAYTNSFLVRREAERLGFNDGIMLDSSGNICEASASNIFFIKDNQLYTPKITKDIFSGITRKLIIDLCDQLNITVNEESIPITRIEEFDSVFLCATLMEIVPVVKIEHNIYHSSENELLKSILFEFEKMKRK